METLQIIMAVSSTAGLACAFAAFTLELVEIDKRLVNASYSGKTVRRFQNRVVMKSAKFAIMDLAFTVAFAGILTYSVFFW